MASRASLIQSRSIYVGTSTGVAPSDGNLIVTNHVGIGTTSPGQVLTAAGNIELTQGANRYIYIGSATNYYYRLQSVGDDFQIQQATNPVLTIKYPNGNVGIGTTNPYSSLQVGNYTGTGGYARGSVATFAGAWNATLPSIVALSTDNTSTINKGGGIGFGSGSEAGSSPYIYAQIKGLKESAGGTYNGYLAFYTTPTGSDANTERMRINGSGNVGINTTSPAYKLDVSGDTRSNQYIFPQVAFNPSAGARTTTDAMSIKMWDNYFSGTGLGSDYGTVLEYYSRNGHVDSQVYFDAAGGSWYRTAAYAGAFGAWQKYMTSSNISGTTNYVSKFTSADSIGNSQIFDNGTNVGIGTTSPSSKLHVAGGDVMISNTMAAGGTIGSLIFKQTNSSGFDVAQIQAIAGATVVEGILTVSTKDSGGTMLERMRITSAGNVGIGTTSPTSKFTVTNGDVEIQSNGSSSMTNYLKIATHTSGSWGSFIAADSYYNSTLNTNLTLGVSNAGSALSVLHITSAGNVGIGTTSPLAKLQVSGGRSYFFSGDNYSIGLAQTAAQGNYMYLGTASDGTFYISETSGTARVTVQQGGNVGIGTTSPAYKLDVVGEGKVTGKFRVGGAVMLAEPGTGVLLFGSEGGSQTAIYSASLERIRINGSGNVGIGTTSPGAKLDIVSTGAGSEGLRVDGAGGGFAFVVKAGSDYTSHIRAGATIGVNYFTTPPSNGLIVEGNVGIGTTAPATKLDVNGVITATGGTSTNWNTAFGWGNHASAGYGLSTRDIIAVDLTASTLTLTRSTSNITAAVPTFNQNTTGSAATLTTARTLTIGATGKTFNGSANVSWSLAEIGAQAAGSYLTAEADTLATVAARGNISNTKLQIRTAGNAAGGNLQLGPYSDGASKWAYITAQHYNSSSEPEGFTLIGGLAQSGQNSVVIGGNIYESNPATEIQFWTHTADTHSTGGTQIATIKPNGLGIGTTSPTQKLHVVGNARITGSIYDSLNSIGNPGDVLVTTATGIEWQAGGASGVSGSGTTNYVPKFTGASAIGNSQIFDNGTNVGIGTTAPGQLLQVNGGSLLVNTGTSATAYRDIMIGGIGGWSTGESHGIDTVYNTASSPTTFSRIESHFDGTNGKIRFRNLFNASAPRTDILMTIQGNGNVGIGTDSPAAKLDVSGTGRFTDTLTASSTAGGTSAIFQNTGAQNSNGIELRGGTAGTSVNWKIEKDNTVGNAFQITPSTANGGTTYTTPSLTIASTGAATFSSSVTASSLIKSGGTASQYLMADGSTSTTSNVAPRYVQTINVSQTAYTTICTIAGNALASAVNMSFQGTSGNVVVNVTAQILVNHFQDISITTTSGFYSQLNIRVISNNNESYSVEAQVISGLGATTDLNIEVFPLNSESVTFGGSPITPGTTLVHTTRQGLYVSASEPISISSSGDIYAATNVGIGTTSPGYKLEVNGGPINIVNGYSEPTSETGYRLKFADNGGINNDSGIGLSGSLGSESLWINKGSANGNIRFMFGTLGEKVTFTSAGNVGIGTTSPSVTLEVSGRGLITSSGSSDTFAVTHSSGSGIGVNITKGGSGEGLYVNKTSGSGNAVTIVGTLNATTLVKSGGTSAQYLMADGSVSTLTNPVTGTGTTNYVSKWASGSAIGNSQVFDDGTYVGIGTASPMAKLHVVGTILAESTLSFNSIASIYQNSNSNLVINNPGWGFSGTGVDITAPGAITIQPGSSFGTYFTAGNVGIGNTGPSEKLHVSGNIRVTGAYYDSANSAGTSGQILSSTATGTAWIAAPSGGGVSGSGTATRVAFWSAASTLTSSANLFWDNTNARLGIGTTSPSAKVHLVEGNFVTRFLVGQSTFTGYNSGLTAGQKGNIIVGQANSTNNAYVINFIYQGSSSTSNSIGLGFFNNDDIVTISANKNVAIATTPTTGYTLTVGSIVGGTGTVLTKGSVKIETGALGVGVNASATAGRIDASNDIVPFSSSDLRLKENVQNITDPIEKIKKLNGIEFDWIEEFESAHGYTGHDTGVIAQEVQEVLPTAVRTNASGYLAVRYEKLIGLLIEAVKEQQTQIDDLKSKLDGFTS